MPQAVQQHAPGRAIASIGFGAKAGGSRGTRADSGEPSFADSLRSAAQSSAKSTDSAKPQDDAVTAESGTQSSESEKPTKAEGTSTARADKAGKKITAKAGKKHDAQADETDAIEGEATTEDGAQPVVTVGLPAIEEEAAPVVGGEDGAADEGSEKPVEGPAVPDASLFTRVTPVQPIIVTGTSETEAAGAEESGVAPQGVFVAEDAGAEDVPMVGQSSEKTTAGKAEAKAGEGFKAGTVAEPRLAGAAEKKKDEREAPVALPGLTPVAEEEAPPAAVEKVAVKTGASGANSAERLAAFMGLKDPGTKAAEPLVAAKAPAPVQSSAGAFSAANSPSIVSAVSGKAMENGGTITLRLDPPEMGALQVAVVMKNGLASVSFSAENSEAAQALTQSMGQLRDSLTAAGISVEKFSVQHVPPTTASNQSSNADSQSNQQSGEGGRHGEQGSGGAGAFRQQDEAARREQQRRELLERMWRRTAGTDVSLVA